MHPAFLLLLFARTIKTCKINHSLPSFSPNLLVSTNIYSQPLNFILKKIEGRGAFSAVVPNLWSLLPLYIQNGGQLRFIKRLLSLILRVCSWRFKLVTWFILFFKHRVIVERMVLSLFTGFHLFSIPQFFNQVLFLRFGPRHTQMVVPRNGVYHCYYDFVRGTSGKEISQ